MAITKRERRLLSLTITAVVAGITIVVLGPLTRQWQTVSRQLVDQGRERDSMRQTIQRSAEWKAEYTKLRGQVTDTPLRYDTPNDVLKKIEELVQASGVIMISQKSMPPQEKGVYRALPVQCTIETNTESLVKFLHALQSGSGFLTVEQLQVSLKPDNTNILRCDIQIHALAGKSEGPSA